MRNPIFLIPGLGGTRLKECNSKRLVWLNAPLFLDCTSKIIKILEVTYDTKRKRFQSKFAVKPDREMGDLRAISNISDPPTDMCTQFDEMIRYLEKIAGYRPGENLFGVPYDWRLILDPEYWAHFKESFRKFIEKQQEYCPTVKAIFIAISMGGLVITKFLRDQTPEWRKRYVEKVITIGTPFGGSPRACLSLCSDVQDVAGLDNYFVKELFKCCAGTYLCQPNKNCFAKLKMLKNYKSFDEKVGRDYGTHEMDAIFDIEEFDTMTVKNIFADTYEDVVNLMDGGPGPEVEVHVICGSSTDTILALDYSEGHCLPHKFKESDYYLDLLGPDNCETLPFGDGIVPYLSATYWCGKKYADGTPYVKTWKMYKGREYSHSDLFRKPEIFGYILSLLEVSSLEDLMGKC